MFESAVIFLIAVSLCVLPVTALTLIAINVDWIRPWEPTNSLAQAKRNYWEVVSACEPFSDLHIVGVHNHLMLTWQLAPTPSFRWPKKEKVIDFVALGERIATRFGLWINFPE